MKTSVNYSGQKSVRFLISICIITAYSLLCMPVISNAQCSAPPVQPTCASGIELIDNDNLTVGITRVVTGTSNFSGLTVNGGTLIVCGTLNLSAITFTSGTIYVCAGGNLSVTTGAAVVFGSNCNLYNYGYVYFSSSIVTGANNLLMNCTLSSQFNIPFNQFVIQGPNTQFVNYGSFTSSYFIVQSNNSPNPVCSGAGSAIETGTMINQYPNAFTSPSGLSCIEIYSQVINSQQMTTSSNVNICYFGSSAAGLNFGNATVSLNCNSCSVALPVDDIQFQGTCINEQIKLRWTVESEQDCSKYDVQLSEDGTTFNDIREINCAGPSLTPLSYECLLNVTPLAHYYARIKRSDIDGNESFSDPLALNCLLGSSIDIFPTYVVGSQITVKSDDRIIAINMYAMDGRMVKNFAIEPNQNVIVLDIGNETALGQYLLTVETPATRVDKLIHIAH